MKHEDYVTPYWSYKVMLVVQVKRLLLATYRERGKIRALEDYLEARLNVSEIEGLEPSPPPSSSTS